MSANPSSARGPAPLTCWAVSDGRRGMANQVLGLAEALARLCPLTIVEKTVALRAPVRWLPYGLLGLGIPDPLRFLAPGSDPVAAPWPDVLIACGRAGAALSLAVRRASGGRTVTVQTQDPRMDPGKFDLVLPPSHDGLTGPTVLPLLGSPHRVTAETLAAGHGAFADTFAALPRPLAGVLIGGSSRAYRLDGPRMRALAGDLRRLSDQGVGLAITTSRRTGQENEAILRTALDGSGAYLWDGSGENPYFGLLAHADHILVTADSTNMVTEAGATGKPVHILPLDGGTAKFDRFHREMAARGVARPFSGQLESWSYEPLAETARAAQAIRSALESRAPHVT